MICLDAATPAPVAQAILGLAYCCMGAVDEGPAGCTCWKAIYDLDQAKPDALLTPGTRPTMCDDCAFRPDSPERRGDPAYDHITGEGEHGLPDIPAGQVFWCHQGMRKPIAWEHETLGIRVAATVDSYEPPTGTIDGKPVPFKADGTPGDRCAGWAAHTRTDD